MSHFSKKDNVENNIFCESLSLCDHGRMAETCNAGARLHKLWYPSIRDTSTWSKFGAHGEHGDVFLFSNLGAL